MLTRKELQAMTIAQIRQICRVEKNKFEGHSYCTRKADLIEWVLYRQEPGSLFLESVKSVCEDEGWTISANARGGFNVVMNSPAGDFDEEPLAGESLASTEFEESPAADESATPGEAVEEAIDKRNCSQMAGSPTSTVERFIKAKSLSDFLNLDSEATDKEKLWDSGPQMYRGLINQNLHGPSKHWPQIPCPFCNGSGECIGLSDDKCPWCEGKDCPTDEKCSVCDGKMKIDAPKKMRWELAEVIPLSYGPVIEKSGKLLCLSASMNPETPWITDRYSAAFLFPGICLDEWIKCIV